MSIVEDKNIQEARCTVNRASRFLLSIKGPFWQDKIVKVRGLCLWIFLCQLVVSPFSTVPSDILVKLKIVGIDCAYLMAGLDPIGVTPHTSHRGLFLFSGNYIPPFFSGNDMPL